MSRCSCSCKVRLAESCLEDEDGFLKDVQNPPLGNTVNVHDDVPSEVPSTRLGGPTRLRHPPPRTVTSVLGTLRNVSPSVLDSHVNRRTEGSTPGVTVDVWALKIFLSQRVNVRGGLVLRHRTLWTSVVYRKVDRLTDPSVCLTGVSTETGLLADRVPRPDWDTVRRFRSHTGCKGAPDHGIDPTVRGSRTDVTSVFKDNDRDRPT